MCRIDDCDSSTVSRQKMVKARKAHRCGECSRIIDPGEVYQYVFMVLEDEPMVWHTCSHCLVASRWLIENCGGWVHEQVLEEIEEHAEEYPARADDLRPIIEGIRAKWAMPDCTLMPLPLLPAPIEIAA